MSDFFPLLFANEQFHLLTALGIGFLFGFALERAGFGNALKLSGQFYLNDMTVFKVMFTAILVAMTGIFSLAAWGWLDLSAVWINPNYLGAQVLGGFLLGVGFIISGLCPGTSVVSLASGKLDGLLVVLGTFLGTFLFALLLDTVPPLHALYTGGSGEVVFLNEIFPFRFPALCLTMTVILVALGAFIGAEKVEQIFGKKVEKVKHTPDNKPRMKFYLSGALFLIALLAAFTASDGEKEVLEAPEAEAIAALTLAEEIIAGDPNLIILDLRSEEDYLESRIPGSWSFLSIPEPLGLLENTAAGSRVLLCNSLGELPVIPAQWPSGLSYHFIKGGYEAWQSEVLTPAKAEGQSLVELDFVRKQNQIAAFFSGATIEAAAAAPPPPPPAGKKKKKKAAGGC